MHHFRFLCLASLALLVPALGARAATFTVTNASASGVGSLVTAINAANGAAGADTIAFAPGVAGVITLPGQPLPALRDDLTIVGPGANVLAVSGGNQAPIFRVASGATARISGLELTGGRAASTTGTSADATAGGAIFVNGNATLIADQLFFNGNLALGGGAIENFGTLQVTNSTFSQNQATLGTGGAIHSTPNSQALMLQNCTFVGNRAADSGGAIRSDIANTALSNLTVVSNLADSDNNQTGAGGGISAGGAAFAVRNSIVSSNSGGDVENVTTANAFNFVGGRGVDAGLEVAGNFFALKNNGGSTPTIAISQSGAAFNGGDPNFDGAGQFDQRGANFLRVKAGRLDIGAFELQTEAPSLVVTTTQDTLADDNQTSLREAINFANTNFDASTITFAPGVSGTIALQTALPVVNFATTIQGPGADKLTITRAQGAANFGLLTLDSNRPPFNYPPFDATISGLTFSGGNAPAGGALNAKKANLTVDSCAFVGNTAFNGGAVYNAVAVRNSTFSGNISTHHGGGFYSLNPATLEQCTFDGNSATDLGGGVFGSAPITIESCTVTSNAVTGNGNPSGGGIALTGTSSLLHNTIVALNTRGSVADDVSGALDASSAFNLIGSGTGASGISNGNQNNQVGTANAPIDPLLKPLANYGGPTSTRALQPGSPAVNAGEAATGLTTDGRGPGFPRVVGGKADIGAFELGAGNRAPSLNNATFSTSVNAPFSMQLPGNDPDGDALTYALASGALPTGLALNAATGVISGTPTVAGRSDFSIAVFDGTDATVARFIIIVSSNADGIGPVTTRAALSPSYTRDALAALVYRGTVRDVAAGGVTPSGVAQVTFQLRRDSDGFAYSGNEATGFTANVNLGYFPAFLSDPTPNTTAGTRDFRRTFGANSFVPSAAVLTPGKYSLVIVAKDVAGNFSVEVVPVAITAATAPASSAIRGAKTASGGNS